MHRLPTSKEVKRLRKKITAVLPFLGMAGHTASEGLHYGPSGLMMQWSNLKERKGAFPAHYSRTGYRPWFQMSGPVSICRTKTEPTIKYGIRDIAYREFMSIHLALLAAYYGATHPMLCTEKKNTKNGTGFEFFLKDSSSLLEFALENGGSPFNLYPGSVYSSASALIPIHTPFCQDAAVRLTHDHSKTKYGEQGTLTACFGFMSYSYTVSTEYTYRYTGTLSIFEGIKDISAQLANDLQKTILRLLEPWKICPEFPKGLTLVDAADDNWRLSDIDMITYMRLIDEHANQLLQLSPQKRFLDKLLTMITTLEKEDANVQ